MIAIRGQLGSGSSEIGRLIATAIGGDYIDREITPVLRGDSLNCRPGVEVRGVEIIFRLL